MHGYVVSKFSNHEGCRMVLYYKHCKTGLGRRVEGGVWLGVGDKRGKISLMLLEMRGNTAL